MREIKINGSIMFFKVFYTRNNYVDRIWFHIKDQITKEFCIH